VPLRVLIVDDNRDAADCLGLLFDLVGAEARVAYGGVDALKQAAEFHPHAGLLDIDMPGMSGLELAREMRAWPRGGPLLLVAVTGVSDEEARRRTAAAGFDHHLTKPVDGSELVRLVNGFYRASYPTEG
jgi:CheY-like chemotaxis protein